MSNRPILIFPAGMPRALEFLKHCRQTGRTIIGASSLAYDPSIDQYPAWVRLPYVTDPTFDEALKQAIHEHEIGEIYTPNFAVWNYLDQHLARLASNVNLANASPVDEVLGGYRTAIRKARAFASHPLALTSEIAPKHLPSEIEIAALYRYTDLIPGMCDDDKIHALLTIAGHAVEGDIVEIGTWWGKSAFILAWLARCFDIGKLLCVDPWSNQHLIQNEKIVDSGSAQVDANEALAVFKMGLIPFNANHINYLRMTSVDGALNYGNNRAVRTEAFGTTEYTGRISILHIDGNHSYEAVKADIDSWHGFMADGGWIIFDDYIWPFGDGPKRVGDAYLNDNRSKITNAFVMGTALFLQLKAG